MPNTILYEQTLRHNAHRMVFERFKVPKGKNYGHVTLRNCSSTLKLAVSWFISETTGASIKAAVTYSGQGSEENDGKKHISTDLAFETQVGE